MDLNLENAKVIVTVGASRIGREIVKAFTEEGAQVAACDSRFEQTTINQCHERTLQSLKRPGLKI
ncbi:MAG: hypothetical protein QGI68_07880 [Pseudomonadales bacterium]|jgi:NAD(P)-dependent dehydrogenase (short-subunit alcohol dehydrogenase family)|nr:hypothetical protein [Pseudomonadales bacterium]MDP7595473.1 hypothetical protein [Pseudomonadales bacterium]HJN52425.1 hypothetical protein [Pseudomonadales bacterium]